MGDNKYAEDMKKFEEMTKPMRFRKARLFFQSVGLTYEVGKDKINYLFNYILYKLHIYKRYNYRDKVVKELPCPVFIKPRSIKTDCLEVRVDMTFEMVTHLDQDYFYREKKDGNKKITYIIKNEETHSLFSIGTLKDITLIISGKEYYVDHLPTFKYAVLVGKPDSPPEFVEYKTMTFDVAYLKNLVVKYLVANDSLMNGVSESMVKYFYDCTCDTFKEGLENVTLRDLTIETTEEE